MKKNNIYQFLSSKGLFLIILFAFVIRMIFFISLEPWNNEVIDNTILVTDAEGYHQLALSLLLKKSFEEFDGFRTPGYPVFVALIYGISSSSVWFVLLIQILLNLISILLVYKIASTIFSRKIALLSAFLFAIDIHQALYTTSLMTETLFVFFFLASIYYFCKSIKEFNLLSIIISAFFLGMATLVRPVSYLFPFVIVIFILVLSSLKPKVKLGYSLLFIIIFLATISPWLINNYSKYGEAKLSSISGYNLLFWNAAYTEVYKTGKSIDEVSKNFYDLAVQQGIDTTDMFSFNNSQIYSNIAQDYIKENLGLYCIRHFMGIINMYTGLATLHIASILHLKSSPLTIDQFGGPGIFTRIVGFYQSKTIGEIFISFYLGFFLLINYLLAFFGIFILIRKNKKFVILFILIVLYFSVLTGVVGLARYRIQFMPFINILCAAGFLHFYAKTINRFNKGKLHQGSVSIRPF